MLTRIQRLSDNKTIGSYSETSDSWSLIQQVVNDEWPCWPDDIDTQEQEDGEELILVRGVPVAKLAYQPSWQ